MVGIIVVLGLVYGRHIINIHYESYVLSRIFKDVATEAITSGADERQITKNIRTRAESEGIGKLYEDTDLVVTKATNSVEITVNYRTCAILTKNWEICADQEVSYK